ncbi:MAG TPA: hypothetical protein PKY73_15760 [Hyphomonas sp.]|jgi:hypothetical protein|nr:hypothetical protein [Hyphomonas sp.]
MQARAGDQWRLYRQAGVYLTEIRSFESLCEAAQCIASMEDADPSVTALTFEMSVDLDLAEFGQQPFQLSYQGEAHRYVVIRDEEGVAASA